MASIVSRICDGIVLEIKHITDESSICSWTLGDNWPYNGEIDIIEGVNLNTQNAMALHTSDGCSINGSGQTGTLISNNCFVNAINQSSNQGCGIQVSYSTEYLYFFMY